VLDACRLRGLMDGSELDELRTCAHDTDDLHASRVYGGQPLRQRT
jgi:hypothetical protein